MSEICQSLQCERNLRSWLFDGKPVAASESGGVMMRWMRQMSEESINALREEAEQKLAQKREEHRQLCAADEQRKERFNALLSNLRQAVSDEDILKVAKALHSNLNEPNTPGLSVFSGYLVGKIGCFNGNHNLIREERKREAQRLEREAEQERRKTAEYAFLLAQGRKRRTLQQAYANGDFIPLDESDEPSLPSITGHRLRSMG